MSKLRAVLEAAVVRHADAVCTVARARPVARDASAMRRHAARVALDEQGLALRDAGVPHVEIYARLNLGYGTVRTWLRTSQFAERAVPTRVTPVPATLARFLDMVHAHLAADAVDVRVDGRHVVVDFRTRGDTEATHVVRSLIEHLRREDVHRNADGELASSSRRAEGKAPYPR